MFQTFSETALPEQGPARLAALRSAMADAGFDGFLVPRADAHQGEYVAPRDERLSWLTGFTGSAGWCAALQDRAGVFVDSRYRVQVKAQVAPCFEPVDWPEVSLAEWLNGALPGGGTIGFDPWLLTLGQKSDLDAKLAGLRMAPCDNLVDAVWDDQPAPPKGEVFAQPEALAGEAVASKLARIGASLVPGANACVITLPDSIAWLLNIRGTDIPRNPVPHAFLILKRDGAVTLFVDPAKVAGLPPLGAGVTFQPPDAFVPALQALEGHVQVDPASCPVAVADALRAPPLEAADPCLLPKARKNPVELQGARDAHLRDALAMVRFLSWLDATDPETLTEIDIVTRLENERRATNALRDISFETIAGAGPNGAIVHYRVSEATNRKLETNGLLLVDSGGQYVDGTTDITRTVALGDTPAQDARDAFTRVLRGMIGLSMLRFPKGMAGRDIDVLARAPLWEAGLDYGHGTGHGVGAYLSVHEGPARIARSGTVALEAGMILSNEPGFYREGAFGIRIENLIAVEEAPALPGQSVPEMLVFETLTYVPIDTRLVIADHMPTAERMWLNAYHAEVARRLGPHLEGAAKDWLLGACRPI